MPHILLSLPGRTNLVQANTRKSVAAAFFGSNHLAAHYSHYDPGLPILFLVVRFCRILILLSGSFFGCCVFLRDVFSRRVYRYLLYSRMSCHDFVHTCALLILGCSTTLYISPACIYWGYPGTDAWTSLDPELSFNLSASRSSEILREEKVQ